jgi:hypothetical protein
VKLEFIWNLICFHIGNYIDRVYRAWTMVDQRHSRATQVTGICCIGCTDVQELTTSVLGGGGGGPKGANRRQWIAAGHQIPSDFGE